MTQSRRWDRQPETADDKAFFDLRESGYLGPIDEHGHAVAEPTSSGVSRGDLLWQAVIGHAEEGRWDDMLAAAKALHAHETGGDEPRCPSCGEPWRLLLAGTVGHCGDERGNDCPVAALPTY